MNVAEMERAIQPALVNKRHDVPIFVQTPSGDWLPAKAASLRQRDSEEILIVYIEMPS
jgi:hypothetical protein